MEDITETQWTDSLKIYLKWYSAVNEKAMASPLPIHHLWCIADKLLGSNKLLLRGWPHWWKRKTPPWPSRSTQPPLFNTTVRACLCTREFISTLLLVGGWCVYTDRTKQTHNLSPHLGWKGPCLYISAWRLSQKAVLALQRWGESSLERLVLFHTGSCKQTAAEPVFWVKWK